MTTITIDGLIEEDFRRSIQNRLREGRPNLALERLRGLLAPYAGPGRILPERFLTVDAADFSLIGWDTLGDAVCQHERPDHPVTGLSIAFGWPGDDTPELDAEGGLQPHIETSYYTDEAFPFSRCKREDLLEGYSFHGCTWSGDSVATDTTLSLEGIDDLHGALAKLEARLLASDEPDEDDIRAGSLGACLLSALLVQAVTERIARDGLPRPLCVMAGSSEVYPYFDAPVIGMPEDAIKAAVVQEELLETECARPASRYSSLSMSGIPRGKKRPVLVLDESEDERANRLAALRSLNPSDGDDKASGWDSTPAADDSPLLAKKPVRPAGEFRDLIGPRAEPAPVDDRSPCELVDLPEPALTATDSERVTGPEFTQLEPDLQQRLQRLIVASAPSADETPVQASPVTLGERPAGPKPHALTAEAIALRRGPAVLWARLRAWPGWRELRRLGQNSSAAIAELRTAGREDASAQQGRKRRLPNLEQPNRANDRFPR